MWSRRGRDLAALNALRVVEVDLADPLPALDGVVDGRAYEGGRVLVRLHSHPLGVVAVDLGGETMPGAELARRIGDELGPAVERHLIADGLAPASAPPAGGLGSSTACAHDAPCDGEPLVSVAIATRDRPQSLLGCLESLLAGTYERFELIVVDNAPRAEGAMRLLPQRVAGDPRVRVVAEPRRGVAVARNRGLAEARGEIVAFLDDDVRVDRSWMRAVVAAFSLAADVACVTALIMPLELETPAQLWLEDYGGFGKGFTRRVFDLESHRPPDPLFPFAAGTFGSGASMAFATEVLRAEGGLDARLTSGGEDLDLFLKVLLAGHRLVYEPSALVWHRHPRDYPALRRTMFAYGAGLSAVIAKWALASPSTARDIAVRLPAAARYALDPKSSKNASKGRGYPRELTRIELAGMLSGPALFARSAWTSKRSRSGARQ